MLNRTILAIGLAIAVFSGCSYASMDGWLAGIQLGRYNADYTAANQDYATITTSAGTTPSTLGPAFTKEDQGRFAGRLFLGYSFNQYLEAELGYTRYQDTTFENIYGIMNANVDLSLQSYDLVGKVKLPLTDIFNVYAKLGIANIKKSVSPNQVAENIQVSGTTLILPDNNQTLYRATYGLGALYQINPTFSVEIGWSRIDGQGQIQQTDFGFIGIVYHFEQFLT